MRPARAAIASFVLASAAVPFFAGSCSQATNGTGTPTPTPGPTATACDGSAPVAGTPALTTRLVGSGFERPLDLQSPPGDCRLFVVEQAGRIKIVRDGSVLATPFLDIRDRVRATENERGLLGLAFHPRYADNGLFYVNYTDSRGDTHIAEFHTAPANADTVDPATERLVLFVTQPFPNHNGGGLAFGPDGFLYIALGDGGSGNDPMGNGQNLGTLLGKMLRIDVDGGSPYATPPDNPFVSRSGAKPEIWAYGLRNPFRFSFDPATGDLLIGDVGQNRMEEIDLGLASRHGGENYGWDITEGSACVDLSGCSSEGFTLPIAEYGHGEGCSVIGGVTYRGLRMPGYHGTYFYSDFCSSFIRSFRVENGAAVDARDFTPSLGGALGHVTSFGTDAAGETYIVDRDGPVYKIVPAS